MTTAKKNDWDAPTTGTTVVDGESVDVLTASRTYPDGSVNQVSAHSKEELAANQQATDAEVRSIQLAAKSRIDAQILEHRNAIAELEEQAEQYEWATK